jgi:dihydrofolate synthase/folylpolyglutamate synthase
LVQTREVWLDGGHNRSAGEVIAAEFEGRRVHLIIGMLAAKDPRALLDPMAGSLASITAVPIEGYETHPPAAFGDCPVLIAGSLYLAGEALRANDEMPD